MDKLVTSGIPSQKGNAYQRSIVAAVCQPNKENLAKFKSHEILHILRDKNTKANVISKLASNKTSVINHSFIQETLGTPCIKTFEVAMGIT